jgi:uncharacterized protein YpuA (DUF1002 family)
MEYKMSNDEFKRAVMEEAQRISKIVEEGEAEAPVLAAAISVVIGCFCAAACTDRDNLEDMVETMVKSIRLEASMSYMDLAEKGVKP